MTNTAPDAASIAGDDSRHAMAPAGFGGGRIAPRIADIPSA